MRITGTSRAPHPQYTFPNPPPHFLHCFHFILFQVPIYRPNSESKTVRTMPREPIWYGETEEKPPSYPPQAVSSMGVNPPFVPPTNSNPSFFFLFLGVHAEQPIEKQKKRKAVKFHAEEMVSPIGQDPLHCINYFGRTNMKG